MSREPLVRVLVTFAPWSVLVVGLVLIPEPKTRTALQLAAGWQLGTWALQLGEWIERKTR